MYSAITRIYQNCRWQPPSAKLEQALRSNGDPAWLPPADEVCQSDCRTVLTKTGGNRRDSRPQHPCVGCITSAFGVRPSSAARLPAAPVDSCWRGLPLPGLGGGAIMLPMQGRHCMRSEEHTSELQSLMRISYADFCLKQKK